MSLQLLNTVVREVLGLIEIKASEAPKIVEFIQRLKTVHDSYESEAEELRNQLLTAQNELEQLKQKELEKHDASNGTE